MKPYWMPILLLLALLCLLADPASAALGVREGLDLALGTAVPALFPFFLLSSLLVETGTSRALGRFLGLPCRLLLGLPASAAPALLLGLTGGYPVGARTVRDLYDRKLLTRSQAIRALACCNNTGPGFLVGLCGASILGSPRLGFVLYAIHAGTALLAGIVLRLLHGSDTADHPQPVEQTQADFSVCFVSSVQRAGITALQVTAFLTAFSALLRLLRGLGGIDLLARLLAPLCPLLGLPGHGAQALVLGGFELTCGLTALPRDLGLGLLPALSVLVALGGCSVWCQSAAVLAGSGLPAGPCIRGKCLHAALAGIAATLLVRLAPDALFQLLPVFAPQLPAISTGMPTGRVLYGFLHLFFSFLLPFVAGKRTPHRL